MKILLEYAVFVGVSVGAHVLVLSQPGGMGLPSGGEGGQEALTLAAMPANMGQLVDSWTRPPSLTQLAPVTAPPALPDTMPAPDLPVLQAPPQAVAQPAPLAAPLAAPQAPVADAQPPIAPDLPAPPLPRSPELPAPSTATTATAPAAPTPVPLPAPTRPQMRPALAQPQARADAPPPPPPPQPQPPVASAPRAAQTAKGAGPAAEAGQSQDRAQQTGAGRAASQRLMAQWGGQVRAKIERKKRYPAGTRAAGKVILRLRLDAAGALHSVSVRRSSGDRALDQAALNAVTQARLPRAPKGLGVGLFTFDLPMSFNR